jgi:HK97 family phage prohead protease
MLEQRVLDPVLLKGRSSDLIVAGYASVEMVDKQGDLITRDALKDAFGKFMKSPGFRNVQLAHSNIQVGEVIPDYEDTSGRMWKSEVDDTGMFVVIKLRSDIEKAREVAAEIRKGNLKSFSIGGQAFERVNKHDGTRGDYREISRMELHEVTICEKGINPEAQFRILKEDTTNEGDTMTDPMNELQNVLERLSKRLDDADATQAEATLKAKEDADKSKDDADKSDDKEKGEDKEKMAYGKEKEEKMTKGDGLDDVITTDYLDWLETTVKSAGFDPAAARGHFEEPDEGVEKSYLQEGKHGYDHRGQGSIEGAGEDDSAKRPKMNFGSAPSGNKNVIKADDYINETDVDPAQVEEAYQVYKAAAMEQQFKTDLGNQFSMRFQKEMAHEAETAAKTSYDARDPIADLQKAVLAMSERIDNVGTTGETIHKSEVGVPPMSIPETTEMAQMSWDDVHRLAGKVLQGGDN